MLVDLVLRVRQDARSQPVASRTMSSLQCLWYVQCSWYAQYSWFGKQPLRTLSSLPQWLSGDRLLALPFPLSPSRQGKAEKEPVLLWAEKEPVLLWAEKEPVLLWAAK